MARLGGNERAGLLGGPEMIYVMRISPMLPLSPNNEKYKTWMLKSCIQQTCEIYLRCVHFTDSKFGIYITGVFDTLVQMAASSLVEVSTALIS
jgi:hypothetical protein